MLYNKFNVKKVNDKKVLKKVKKEWVVVSVAFLSAVGGYAYSQQGNTVNADTTTQGQNDANHSNENNMTSTTSNDSTSTQTSDNGQQDTKTSQSENNQQQSTKDSQSSDTSAQSSNNESQTSSSSNNQLGATNTATTSNTSTSTSSSSSSQLTATTSSSTTSSSSASSSSASENWNSIASQAESIASSASAAAGSLPEYIIGVSGVASDVASKRGWSSMATVNSSVSVIISSLSSLKSSGALNSAQSAELSSAQSVAQEYQFDMLASDQAQNAITYASSANILINGKSASVVNGSSVAGSNGDLKDIIASASVLASQAKQYAGKTIDSAASSAWIVAQSNYATLSSQAIAVTSVVGGTKKSEDALIDMSQHTSNLALYGASSAASEAQTVISGAEAHASAANTYLSSAQSDYIKISEAAVNASMAYQYAYNLSSQMASYNAANPSKQFNNASVATYVNQLSQYNSTAASAAKSASTVWTKLSAAVNTYASTATAIKNAASQANSYYAMTSSAFKANDSKASEYAIDAVVLNLNASVLGGEEGAQFYSLLGNVSNLQYGSYNVLKNNPNVNSLASAASGVGSQFTSATGINVIKPSSASSSSASSSAGSNGSSANSSNASSAASSANSANSYNSSAANNGSYNSYIANDSGTSSTSSSTASSASESNTVLSDALSDASKGVYDVNNTDPQYRQDYIDARLGTIAGKKDGKKGDKGDLTGSSQAFKDAYKEAYNTANAKRKAANAKKEKAAKAAKKAKKESEKKSSKKTTKSTKKIEKKKNIESTSAHTSSISGYWHTSDLKVSVHGNYATANGYSAKLKKTGHNKWVSIYNKKQEGQPFSLHKVGNTLNFRSGMDKEKLHR